jgi:RNA polymerase sigma-70 factor (ECF subfamily)
MRLVVPPEIIEAARDAQATAVEDLLRLVWPHAYRIARSIIADDTLAQDAAQETCAIIYRDIRGLRSIDAFRAWVYRIAAREAVRMAKHHAQHPSQFLSEPPIDIDGRLDILRALGHLSVDLRVAVVLRYYAHLNSAEIGAALGVPSATVRFRLALARKRLQKLLQPDHYGAITEASL